MSPPESEQNRTNGWIDLAGTLAVLLGPHGWPINEWATVRWRDLRQRGPTWWVLRVAGEESDLSEELWSALLRLGQGFCVAGYRPRDEDSILAALPGKDSRFMDARWIRTLLQSDVDCRAYLNIREVYEAELAAGVSDRAAWERARAALLRRPLPDAGRPGARPKLDSVPVELRAAYTQLGQRAGLVPTTAKGYRSALLRLFERTGGKVPSAAELGLLLNEVAEGLSYCAGVRSAWAALVRSAEVDGIDLPQPPARR
jgi:hypothetical protein